MERLTFFKARQQAKPAKAQDCVWERPGACSVLQVH